MTRDELIAIAYEHSNFMENIDNYNFTDEGEIHFNSITDLEKFAAAVIEQENKWQPIETCPLEEQVMLCKWFDEEKLLMWVGSGSLDKYISAMTSAALDAWEARQAEIDELNVSHYQLQAGARYSSDLLAQAIKEIEDLNKANIALGNIIKEQKLVIDDLNKKIIELNNLVIEIKETDFKNLFDAVDFYRNKT